MYRSQITQRKETITWTFCSCSTFSLWAACQWLNKCPLTLSEWHFLSVSSINSLPKKQCWLSFKVIPPITNRERFCVTYDKIEVKWEILEIFTLCYSTKTNVNSQKSEAWKFHGACDWYDFSGVHQLSSKQKFDVSETITIFFMDYDLYS